MYLEALEDERRFITKRAIEKLEAFLVDPKKDQALIHECNGLIKRLIDKAPYNILDDTQIDADPLKTKLKKILEKRMEAFNKLRIESELLEKRSEILEKRLLVLDKIRDIQSEKSTIFHYCEKNKDNQMLAEKEIKASCERIRQKCVEIEEILDELFISTE